MAFDERRFRCDESLANKPLNLTGAVATRAPSLASPLRGGQLASARLLPLAFVSSSCARRLAPVR
jgi:hypothetical protein